MPAPLLPSLTPPLSSSSSSSSFSPSSILLPCRAPGGTTKLLRIRVFLYALPHVSRTEFCAALHARAVSSQSGATSFLRAPFARSILSVGCMCSSLFLLFLLPLWLLRCQAPRSHCVCWQFASPKLLRRGLAPRCTVDKWTGVWGAFCLRLEFRGPYAAARSSRRNKNCARCRRPFCRSSGATGAPGHARPVDCAAWRRTTSGRLRAKSG